MIETQDLCKQFDDFVAVAGISFNVQAGEVLALLGPNGAGKTTTVRMLTSVLRPSGGWARIAGYDVVRQAAQVRASVGVLTELHGLYGRMPADEYLDFFGRIYNMSRLDRQQQSRLLLEQFGLYQDRHRKVGEYSKGMRQKLALARALLHNPPVLLLDEPTSAIIICTHNLPEAEELADQIAIIRRGKIIARGTPEGLKQELLGPPEYEVRLGVTLDSRLPDLPPQVTPTGSGPDWFCFSTDQPQVANPAVLQRLAEQNYPVITLQEMPRSLEKVYLQAINVAENNHA